MRKIGMLFVIMLVLLFSIDAKASFENNFTDQTLRIDYVRTGDAKSEILTLDRIYRYGKWAGNPRKTIDKFNNGRNYVEIRDANTNEILFSKGFDSLFGEYQSTGPALKGIKRAFTESILIPNPKSRVRFVFMKRNKQNKLYKFFETTIDPNDVNIIDGEKKDPSVKVVYVKRSGDPHYNVDVVILGEGYTSKEFSKFKKDLNFFTKLMLTQEPYASSSDSFNIVGVYKPSVQSGTDVPTAGAFANTVLNTSFNTLGSERYLMTEDNKAMRDLAGNVPYDAIYIMVNHKRYGGGGIYNQYATFTTGNQWKEYVFVHEYGHSFTGLADEYYTSAVQYNDFYPRGVEPTEPNITALLKGGVVKWESLATPGIRIPTSWAKEPFDESDLKWQKERREMVSHADQLQKDGASENAIDAAWNEYDTKDRDHNKKVKAYMKEQPQYSDVGAFEGAGYSSTGLYRPQLDCIMFSKGIDPFCKVCQGAIKNVMAHYTR